MALPRSTYYYKSRDKTRKEREDADLRDRMEQLALRFPRYGYLTCPPKAVPVRKLVFGTKKGSNNAYQAIYAGTNNQQTARG